MARVAPRRASGHARRRIGLFVMAMHIRLTPDGSQAASEQESREATSIPFGNDLRGDTRAPLRSAPDRLILGREVACFE